MCYEDLIFDVENIDKLWQESDIKIFKDHFYLYTKFPVTFTFTTESSIHFISIMNDESH